jgi:hypothetical protein
VPSKIVEIHDPFRPGTASTQIRGFDKPLVVPLET